MTGGSVTMSKMSINRLCFTKKLFVIVLLAPLLLTQGTSASRKVTAEEHGGKSTAGPNPKTEDVDKKEVVDAAETIMNMTTDSPETNSTLSTTVSKTTSSPHLNNGSLSSLNASETQRSENTSVSDSPISNASRAPADTSRTDKPAIINVSPDATNAVTYPTNVKGTSKIGISENGTARPTVNSSEIQTEDKSGSEKEPLAANVTTVKPNLGARVLPATATGLLLMLLAMAVA